MPFKEPATKMAFRLYRERIKRQELLDLMEIDLLEQMVNAQIKQHLSFTVGRTELIQLLTGE